jgi:purine-nucleoside phosphorylase
MLRAAGRLTEMSKRDTYIDQIESSLAYIRKNAPHAPDTAVVLGSGLGEFAENLRDNVSIPVSDIPHYPVPSIPGHNGRLIFGRIGPTQLLSFQGRTHFYESNDLGNVLYPILIAHGLGVKKILLTNAAGAVNRLLRPGDLMLIHEQINLTFKSIDPYLLDGSTLKPAAAFNERLYDPKLCELIGRIAQEKGIPLQRGVYCGVLGPSYESASEIEMIRRMGGDAVGMSTVNEARVASALGMRVAGISCITNMATGILPQKLSHNEVTEVADRVKGTFSGLLTGVMTSINTV